MTSECSSGESGWTLYLEHSFLSPNTKFVDDAKTGFCHDDDQQRGRRRNKLCVEAAEEEEEDLSMVSDASSGPPLVNEDEGFHYNVVGDRSGCSYNSFKAPTLSSNGGKKKQKMKERRRIDNNQEPPSSYNLDDTASSTAFSKSNFGVTDNNQASMESVLDYSQGFSATHFEGRSAYQDHQFGFPHPSWSGNQLHHNNQLSNIHSSIFYFSSSM